MIAWKGNRRFSLQYKDKNGTKQRGDITLQRVVTQGEHTFLFGLTHPDESKIAIPLHDVYSAFMDWETGEAGTLQAMLGIELPTQQSISHAGHQAQQPAAPTSHGNDRQQRIDRYVEENRKSSLGAFLLALAFGPIGYLYASPLGGVILTLIALLTINTFIGPLIIWLICLISAPITADAHNEKLRTKAELIAG